METLISVYFRCGGGNLDFNCLIFPPRPAGVNPQEFVGIYYSSVTKIAVVLDPIEGDVLERRSTSSFPSHAARYETHFELIPHPSIRNF